ncbi:hypoxia up-regulated 1 [Fusarium albosuccineum]|uniref:Hypoxia up-regulated 1 n=1 Tax=Fusarium albosuccineum TaxID=1237068 RepID=A0A8H4PHA6_9HYPO|nr:hypoxia up-regulated 1 [Fusarium albosuccineum]
MATTRVSPLMTLLAAVFLFATNVFAAAAVLGVDLGTEYIKAALVKPGIPLEIVLTKDSRRKETSAVVFKPSRNGPQKGQFPERAYGADAMALAPRFPSDVYPNLKTILGLTADDAVVKEYAARHPALQLQAHPSRGTATFKSKAFTAEEEAWMVEELLAMELQSIQKNAEVTAGDGTSVRSIVLTVPPFYTVDEKRAVQTAAELAGLKVLSLMSEGLAVGLNYATSREFPNVSNGSKAEHNIVFDMGAGSTIATVIRFQSRSVKDIGKFNKTVQEVQVLGAGWDRTLGGDALNNLILDDMVSQFVESKGAKKVSVAAEDVKAHGRAVAKLTNQVEKVRHVLSANQNTGASFEGLYEDIDFKYKITRAEFEEMAAAHAERITVVINDALKMANLDIIDIDSIILHGGATRTPFVQKVLEKLSGSTDKIRSNVNSDEAAVFGAGFRAAELSPSFRVKEIRIAEGGMYSAGLKWTTSKDKTQHQRLWSAVSPQGAAPKELTFTDGEDFTATFYQQIGSEEKDTKTLTTKNLTATVAAIKEKHPSCVESEIQFKLAVRLSGENGEVEIVKAAVECEAEVKDGFVDGVKNLFGFGKKDQKEQKPLKDEKTEGSEEEMKGDASKKDSSTASTESSTSSGADSKASGSTEELKPEVKKRETVGIPVDVILENAGMPGLSKAEITKSKDRLKAFAASDRARLQREEALNQLEAFTYKIRDLLEVEAFIEASTEKERTKLAELSSETSEWLYDDGADATKEVLKAKLKVLQDLVTPIQKRADEAAKRPEVITSLKEALDKTTEFVNKIKEQIAEHESWHKSASASASASESIESSSTDAAAEKATGEFDGLEDEDSTAATARKMEDIIKEKGPIPPLYTLDDLTELIALHKSTQEWLNEMEPKQVALSAVENPVLLVKDLNAKREKLEKVAVEVAVKGAKKVEEKSRQAKKSAKAEKKSKKSKTTSGEASQETLQFNPEDFMKNGEIDKEELERLVKKIQQESEKKGEAEKKPKHDEL